MNEKEIHKYDDIMNLPHHVSKYHPRMALSDRAAQFSPFAALTGHEDAIRETGRLTEQFRQPDEETREQMDACLRAVIEHITEMPQIEAVCFKPDARKSGGSYLTCRGRVKKVDLYNRKVIFLDGTQIPLSLLVSLEFYRDGKEYDGGIAENE